MKRVSGLFIGLCLLTTGCATIVNRTEQGVTINSTPNDAVVEIYGQEVGKTPWSGLIERKEILTVTIKKDGFIPKDIKLEGRLSGWMLGNICCGLFGILGSITDGVSGAAFEYSPESYHVALEPLDKTVIPVIEGQTKLKRYILANWSNIGAEIVSTPSERVDALKEIMGYPNKPIIDFAKMIKPDYLSSKTPDDFAEKMLLISK